MMHPLETMLNRARNTPELCFNSTSSAVKTVADSSGTERVWGLRLLLPFGYFYEIRSKCWKENTHESSKEPYLFSYLALKKY